LRESGAISDKSFVRIRATERRREREYRLVDKGPLVAELEEKVIRMMGRINYRTELGYEFTIASRKIAFIRV
jgi:hypothetical protein